MNCFGLCVSKLIRSVTQTKTLENATHLWRYCFFKLSFHTGQYLSFFFVLQKTTKITIMLRRESCFVLALSQNLKYIHLIICSLNQNKRKLKKIIFFFRSCLQLYILPFIVIKVIVINKHYTFLAENSRRKISHILQFKILHVKIN